jgi:glycosyltransferase involved in cell wall biosynthesis
MARIAVYGDVDLNLIDGSAVWLASLVETLSVGDCEIEVFLKAPQKRRVLSGQLAGLRHVACVPPTSGARHADPGKALDQIERADDRRRFHAIILRGFRLAKEAARRPQLSGRLWTYVTDIPQTREAMDSETTAALADIADASQFVLCQTEDLRSLLEGLVPETCRKTALLPPMIPPPRKPPRPAERTTVRRMVYAGKFAPLWATLEMVRLFEAHRRQHPDFELHVFGDKIHKPKDRPGYAVEMQAALEGTPGLQWHRATPRQALLDRLPEMDVAWAWRLPQINESLELSTKLLEYGAAGVPAILCRNDIHEQLLGARYPLFADSLDEAAALLDRLAQDRRIIAEATECLRARCHDHIFAEVHNQRLRPLLQCVEEAPVSSRPRPRTVLVAGHDLKFINPILDRLRRRGHGILIDQWKGHRIHDADQSRRLLAQADTVLCEWCLGNAVWYSRHVSDGQKLVVRLHAQEVRRDYPGQVRLDNVSQVVFVGPHMRDQVMARFGWGPDKLCVIPNAVDPVDMVREKLRGAQFNLGMLGICPAQKGFDRALDVLEELRARDPRFTLYIKGKMPWDYAWLWKRPPERAYYEGVFDRLWRSPLLAQSVVFDSPGPDVAAWLRKIGFVLSVSEHESFHLAVAEGAASGAVPIVLNWPGAAELYPNDWISPDLPSAAQRIRDLSRGGGGEFPALRASVRQFATERFALDHVADAMEKLLV